MYMKSFSEIEWISLEIWIFKREIIIVEIGYLSKFFLQFVDVFWSKIVYLWSMLQILSDENYHVFSIFMYMRSTSPYLYSTDVLLLLLIYSGKI